MRKEIKKVRKPKWDTEFGRLLWLDGRKDGEIADEFGIATSVVTAYRKRHWEQGNVSPPPQNQSSENTEPVSEPVAVKEELPVPEETKHEDAVSCLREPENVYEVLEAATRTLSGIRAICTADAILCLWNWNRPEDLERAKSAIDYLLKKEEEKQ
ncbi:MAG: hypothetical protein J6C98_05815 [Oscillospiraceae bacterium]|nr:hypothetical protein [Oscillospiraceae bacterium]